VYLHRIAVLLIAGILAIEDTCNARWKYRQVDAGAVARKDWPTLNTRTSIRQAMDCLKTFAVSSCRG